jgi:hypothetical protein
MTAVSFESGNQSLGMSLLKKGIKKFKEDLDKFYEYFEEYKDNKEIMDLLDQLKD